MLAYGATPSSSPRSMFRAPTLGRSSARRWSASSAMADEYGMPDATVSAAIRHLQWQPRVLEILGRVSPELQEVIITCTLESLPAGVRIVMPRHIPWGRVAAIHRQMAAHPRVRVAWMTGIRQREAACSPRGGLCPAYPAAPVAIQARITRGEAPASIGAGVGLTPAETHQWLREGAPDEVVLWYGQTYLEGTIGEGVYGLRTVPVMRWLRSVHDRGLSDHITRERVTPGPDGQEIRYNYRSKLDEIMDEDLVHGLRTTPRQAFEAAAKRAGAEYQNRLLGDHRVISRLPSHWRLYRGCMALLDTPAKLATEGASLDHCVGTYVSTVDRGESIILAISVRGHRSTVEISPSGSVRQHYGPGNTTPHPLCQRVLARFLGRIGAQRSHHAST